MVDIVPTFITSHSLLSINKFAKANYITMFMPTVVHIYNREATKITSSQPLVVTGFQEHSNPMENANNLFEIANSNKIIAYNHVTAGFSTKPIWLAAIHFFAT